MKTIIIASLLLAALSCSHIKPVPTVPTTTSPQGTAAIINAGTGSLSSHIDKAVANVGTATTLVGQGLANYKAGIPAATGSPVIEKGLVNINSASIELDAATRLIGVLQANETVLAQQITAKDGEVAGLRTANDAASKSISKLEKQLAQAQSWFYMIGYGFLGLLTLGGLFVTVASLGASFGMGGAVGSFCAGKIGALSGIEVSITGVLGIMGLRFYQAHETAIWLTVGSIVFGLAAWFIVIAWKNRKDGFVKIGVLPQPTVTVTQLPPQK